MWQCPRSWNFSSDAKMSSTMRDSYHSRKSDERKSSQFLVLTLLFARLSSATNLPLNTVYFYNIMYNVSHTLKHNFSHIFEELARFVSRVYHGTSQYAAFERRINLAPSESCAVSHLHKTSTASFELSSRAIRAIKDCLTPIDNCRRLMWLCSSSNSIKSLPTQDILLAYSIEWFALTI